MSSSREPVFNAPWPVTASAVTLVVCFVVQLFLPPDFVYGRLGFSPAGLEAGQRVQLVTALFVHGGWAHLLLNAVGALAVQKAGATEGVTGFSDAVQLMSRKGAHDGT